MFKSKRQVPAKPSSFRTQYKWECITSTHDSTSIIASTIDGKIVIFNSTDYTVQKEVQINGYPTGSLAKQRVIGILKSRNIEYDQEEMNKYDGNENFPIKEILLCCSNINEDSLTLSAIFITRSCLKSLILYLSIAGISIFACFCFLYFFLPNLQEARNSRQIYFK